MAHIEVWWRCPGCHLSWTTQREAVKCAASHVRPERWAVSDRHPGEAFALREADLSDFIEERRRELEEGR